MKVGITLLKKLKKQKKKDYNWVGKYIKEYNERVLYYEKQLDIKCNWMEQGNYKQSDK